jgi:hypothetical protein
VFKPAQTHQQVGQRPGISLLCFADHTNLFLLFAQSPVIR